MYTLNAAALLTVLPHVSTSESRPMCQNVLLRKDGVAVATNGYALAMHRNAHTVPVDVIIAPTKELKALAQKAVKAKNAPLIVLVDATSVMVTFGGTTVTLAVDEGPYPHVEQVFRDAVAPVTRLGVNTKLLAAFGDDVVLHFGGSDRAMRVTVPGNEDFIGLLMPKAIIDATGEARPDWITEAPVAAKVAA